MTHDELITLLVRDDARYDTLTAVSVAVKERDAAREALSAIGMHLDPTEDSLQALIATFVDEGLGEIA